jgi:hypothetical protein
MGSASRFENVMPTFVIEDVFVVVESLMQKKCKGKSLELSLLHYFIFVISCVFKAWAVTILIQKL